MCFASIYEEMRANDLIVGNHESDLYVLDCEKSREILAKWPVAKGISVRFKEYANDSGSRWLWEIPFAYEPFRREQAQARARQRALVKSAVSR